jgi:DNA-binding NarL/FixJ family response regulator
MISSKKISVLLADDHVVVREGFRSLLATDHDIEVVGEAQDGRQAVGLTISLRPEVVLMDIAMPLMNGLEATRQIAKAAPETRVLILSAHSDEVYIATAIDAGAVGFLTKQTSASDVSSAIRAVLRSDTFIRPIPRHGSSGAKRSGRLPRISPALSSREMEVLQLISEGSGNKGIAVQLAISVKTVEKHREHLMAKLDIHDTAGLTRYAIAAGIIENSVQITIA